MNTSRLARIDFSRLFPLVLIGVVILAYGVFIPWLGFYLDDWYIVWFRHFFGSTAFTQFFAQDRPFLAWIYVVLTPIFGDSPLAWQSFAVLTRWILGLAFWDLLKQLWPQRKWEAALGSLFFSVFPGFQFHWFSVQYSQVYLIEAGMFFSLACSLRAARNPSHAVRWTLAGLLPGIYAVISVEYHFGFELLRPVLMWLVLASSGFKSWRRIGRTALLWLPYFIPFLAFSIWRIFFFQSFMYKITLLDNLSSNPLAALGSLAGSTLQELADGFVLVWGQIFNPASYSLASRTLLLVIALVGFTFFGLLVFLFTSSQRSDNETVKNRLRWAAAAVLLGLVTGMLTLIPFQAAGLPVRLAYPWNRFMIVLGVGASISAVGLIMLLPRPLVRAAAASLILALSIGSQLNTANQFRVAWANQQKLFWQLSWRIPGMQADTMLVTDSLPISRYYSGPSLSAPLNWIYAPDLVSRKVPYQVILTESPQIDTSHTIRPNESVNLQYRSWSFSGNTSDSIFFIFSKDCLQVLSYSTNSSRMVNVYHEPGFLTAIGVSNPNRIIANPSNPISPSSLFGDEPIHGWCYYYEKADLARQQADWKKVLETFNQAEALGFIPLNDTELYPKIEAWVMTDDWQSASQLTKELLAKDPFLNRGLCAIWERGAQNNPPQGSDRSLAEEIVPLLACPELDEVLH